MLGRERQVEQRRNQRDRFGGLEPASVSSDCKRASWSPAIWSQRDASSLSFCIVRR
jgi:hypothetical protein